jgi:predicted N-acetyltransferase YhbS
MEIVVRQETDKDRDSVYRVVKGAFAGAEHTNGDEHNLVNRLRRSPAFVPELSLVAEQEGEIVGHILFTRMTIDRHPSLALAPLAIAPAHQRRGIGGRLIREGHGKARELGFDSVIVVGHADYYPRFGYAPASRWNIQAPFEVPDACFLALELAPNALERVSGMIAFAPEFFEK